MTQSQAMPACVYQLMVWSIPQLLYNDSKKERTNQNEQSEMQTK
jgi:hypothetical protein